ncbi:hypothetical protein BKA63DRAFT_63364 [Paraphoma chrysanthemicola]|nr:hypothetical protein BKA63DRAFT_63364 [Paraphoma chrysanthemicola]
MAQTLQPLPQSGLSLYPGYLATKPETFHVKGRNAFSGKASYLISYASHSGEALTPYLEIIQDKKGNIIFKTLQGEEVMRIVKEVVSWSGKTTYRGSKGDGVEMWNLRLKTTLRRTEYNVKFIDASLAATQIQVQNKVSDAEKGILINGQPGVTMSRQGKWEHLHRVDLVNVAPGMDILLALGVNWIRADKQNEDKNLIVAAVTG